jgi:large subunit ribosomal protein L10
VLSGIQLVARAVGRARRGLGTGRAGEPEPFERSLLVRGENLRIEIKSAIPSRATKPADCDRARSRDAEADSMARKLKDLIVADFQRRFTGVRGGVLVDFAGLNSEQTANLRRELRQSGVRMQVLQNRLAIRSFKTGSGAPEAFFRQLKGPSALLYGEDGALTASKVITKWQKANKGLAAIKGGFIESQALNEAQVADLATIPDQGTLRSGVLGLFISPAQILASCAQSVVANFAGCVKARHEDVAARAADAGVHAAVDSAQLVSPEG